MDPRLTDLSGLDRRPTTLWRESGWWGRPPLWERVRNVAANEPAKVAVIDGATLLSYAALWQEAMRQGLPVVATRTSSLPEVGGEAVLYVPDARDSAALAEAVERLRGDQALRRRLVAAGRKRAARFSWDACARGLADAIRARLSVPAPARSARPPSPR